MKNNILIQESKNIAHLSDKKVRIFSAAIAPDIARYIADNKTEFNTWLLRQSKVKQNSKS